MNSSSRRNTLPGDTTGIPVLVHGLERTWSYKCNESKYTAVAVRRGPSVCNGVLIEIQDLNYLSLLDQREKEYERAIINHSNIQCWNTKDKLWNDENSVIWVYQLPNASQVDHLPSDDYPIPQTYIDTIIAGCLNYGHEFTKAFLQLTRGWTRDYLKNDRHNPLKKFTFETISINPKIFDYLIQENVRFE
jgi:hypothetical protein